MLLFQTSWRECFDATNLVAGASKLGFQAVGCTNHAYFVISFVYAPGEPQRCRIATAEQQFVALLRTHAAGRFVSLVVTNEKREAEAGNEDG